MANRSAIPEREVKRLYAVSGNRCAFTSCDQLLCEPGTADEPGVVTGEMAHIVAASRQGPRGRASLGQDARNTAENLILLCERHHKIVDGRPHTYTVDVLREIKRRHEAPFVQVSAAPTTPTPMTSETLLSSLLLVSELPERVRVAPYLVATPREVASNVRWNADAGPVPFITRDKCVLAFHDLRAVNGPFARVVDRGAVETLIKQDLCATADGQRRYVELLNRTLSSHLRTLGIRFDPAHHRYFFSLPDDGTRPRVEYRSKTGRSMSREVVREAMRRDGQSKGFWWHQAVSLRFMPLPISCVLSIRPEFHLTTDGREPLNGSLVGRRVTRRKSRIYNGQYIDHIQFWREVITGGRPRVILRVGGQRLAVENELLTAEVRSPGVPNDALSLDAGPVADDLFSLLDADDIDYDDDLDDWDDDED